MERQQFSRQCRKAAGVATRPSGLERVISPWDETKLAHADVEQLHLHLARSGVRSTTAENPDHRYLLLRARRKGPPSCSIAEKGNEIAPSQCRPQAQDYVAIQLQQGLGADEMGLGDQFAEQQFLTANVAVRHQQAQHSDIADRAARHHSCRGRLHADLPRHSDRLTVRRSGFSARRGQDLQ
jgi:hypothetical protein